MPETVAAATAVLGVDVGGSSVKAQVVDGSDQVIAVHRVPTPTGDPGADRLAQTLRSLVATATRQAAAVGSRLTAAGLVVPGVVDDDAGFVHVAENLGWRNVAVRDRVAAALPDRRLPLAFGQDVRGGAMAEVGALLHGPARASTRGTVAFVPLGTGMASALVVRGRVLSSAGWAGEIGQVRIAHGPHAGARVEQIASAGAVARRAGAADAAEVARRVRSGDVAAKAVWHDCLEVLADALCWLTAVSGCDVIVVGGGLAESGDLLLRPLAHRVRERLPTLQAPVILPARYGDTAGARGAVLMARELAARSSTRP